ncbi:MAG: MOSC domain-containing protein [Oligoflexus sp.]
MYVHSLHIYPIKGGQRHTLSQTKALQTGLQQDREFMLIDANGKFVSQRSLPQLTLLKTEFYDQVIRISYQEEVCEVDTRAECDQRTAYVWSDEILVHDLGDTVATALSAMFQRELRLVALDRHKLRQVKPVYTDQKTVSFGFADGFPYLICTLESLEDLNRRLEQKSQPRVPMDRFRPNIVLGGGSAFLEDEIDTLSIGTLKFKLCKSCTRCNVTTIDQQTGRASKEPLATLASYRYDPVFKGVTFGQNAYLLEGHGSLIKTGDTVAWTMKPSR